MVSLSNHEVGHTDIATTSSFDTLRMRSTGMAALYPHTRHTHGVIPAQGRHRVRWYYSPHAPAPTLPLVGREAR